MADEEGVEHGDGDVDHRDAEERHELAEIGVDGHAVRRRQRLLDDVVEEPNQLLIITSSWTWNQTMNRITDEATTDHQNQRCRRQAPPDDREDRAGDDHVLVEPDVGGEIVGGGVGRARPDRRRLRPMAPDRRSRRGRRGSRSARGRGRRGTRAPCRRRSTATAEPKKSRGLGKNEANMEGVSLGCLKAAAAGCKAGISSSHAGWAKPIARAIGI